MIGQCSTGQQPKQPATVECEFCTLAVNLIKTELALGNATIEMIIEIVKELCKEFGIPVIKKEVSILDSKVNKLISGYDVIR